MNIRSRLLAVAVLAGLAETAFAGEIHQVSEPGTLTLLGLAGVVAVVTVIRRRRK